MRMQKRLYRSGSFIQAGNVLNAGLAYTVLSAS